MDAPPSPLGFFFPCRTHAPSLSPSPFLSPSSAWHVLYKGKWDARRRQRAKFHLELKFDSPIRHETKLCDVSGSEPLRSSGVERSTVRFTLCGTVKGASGITMIEMSLVRSRARRYFFFFFLFCLFLWRFSSNKTLSYLSYVRYGWLIRM